MSTLSRIVLETYDDEARVVTHFRLPYEHGAWWTFFSCLGAGLALALGWRADLFTALALALGMSSFFLASDWVTDFAHSIVIPERRRKLRTRPWQGYALSGGGVALLSIAFWHIEGINRGLGQELAAGLVIWGWFLLAVLWLRLKLPARSLGLLMPSAVLLTAPALLLAGLAFGQLGVKALGFWALSAWFFAFGVVYVQTWLRGAQLPSWRIYAASLPYLAEALLLGIEASYLSMALMLVMSGRIFWRLHERVLERKALEDELEGKEMPARLPTDPSEIRKLGWEQVAWSFVLGAVWVWRYLP